ncbi:MAG: T9SS type A sorting domain-containing protein [Crocinitomicaceae bacterium]|nr:T9SS type A sorting domain-containing protein [Crocinitomicaceae bacterium]
MKLINSLIFVAFATVSFAQQLVMETGSVVINHTTTSVSFNNTFADPVVIALPPTINGAHQSTINIFNVTTGGFDLNIQEADNMDGSHTTETVHYIVVEKGNHTFPDGTNIQAGTISSASLTFQNINFSDPYPLTPAIFTQVQTNNSSTNYLKTRQRNATINSFDVKLERGESTNTTAPSASEEIGYVSISKGIGIIDGVQIEVNSFTASNANTNHTLTTTFNPGNHVIASISTFNGPDPSGLRINSLTTTSVNLFVEEDTSNDTEVNHAVETIDYFIFNDNASAGIFLPSPLPIELIAFSVVPNADNHIQIDWATATEKDNSFFTIERSTDCINWEDIENIPGALNSQEVLFYTTTDRSPYQFESFYRLRQTDIDGAYSYSPIRAAHIEPQVNIYPNPAQDFINVKSNVAIDQIRLVNLSGVEALTIENYSKLNNEQIMINVTSLPAGLYTLIIDGKKEKIIKR